MHYFTKPLLTFQKLGINPDWMNDVFCKLLHLSTSLEFAVGVCLPSIKGPLSAPPDTPK